MKMKVLGTIAYIPPAYKKKVEEYTGRELTRNEFRVICKCKGINDANKKCAELGFRSTLFSRAYTSETGNETEVSLCEKEDVWVAPNISGKPQYVPISILRGIDKDEEE